MQVYNLDETGVTIVHRLGKVVTEVGRRNVHAITLADKGKPTQSLPVCLQLPLFYPL